MAEDIDNGPDGIVANQQWIYFASCPRGHFLRRPHHARYGCSLHHFGHLTL